ncbi:MAG: hypothetical protein QOE70_1383 [Chthoniobacter sp.]|nr:hypothetical protein [Chthoniobacter sp.]
MSHRLVGHIWPLIHGNRNASRIAVDFGILNIPITDVTFHPAEPPTEQVIGLWLFDQAKAALLIERNVPINRQQAALVGSLRTV